MLAPFGLATLTAATSTLAAFQGFNYGSVLPGGGSGVSDFENAFRTAQGLVGTGGKFSSARLYTTIVRSTTESAHRHILTRLIASRHGKFSHLGHPGGHKHQNQSASWYLGVCWSGYRE